MLHSYFFMMFLTLPSVPCLAMLVSHSTVYHPNTSVNSLIFRSWLFSRVNRMNPHLIEMSTYVILKAPIQYFHHCKEVTTSTACVIYPSNPYQSYRQQP
ncbi:uncharacterized protein K441DRAFT_348654 [Cenococcum geophilum 1.58]|uniref:Uncharacterized protein n=1 Tax=Cenococcum geophilum 1.58 TaxID=794803 RepID=A0ACC8EN18_9PEZI|nr:hypothetical protein K441DRAFT_348654 [Cenococcum geophilum 1.58]